MQQRAFTLVEIIVGITVLTIVLVAIGVLTITSIRANQVNINRLTAYYLAQEAVEGFRSMRDSNWIQNYAWNKGGNTFWGDDFDETGYYVIDYKPEVFVTLNSDPERAAPWQLTRYDTENKARENSALEWANGRFYLHEPPGLYEENEPTIYHRYVRVSPFEPTHALELLESLQLDLMEVTAIVFWQDHGHERSVEVSTEFSDWRAGPL